MHDDSVITIDQAGEWLRSARLHLMIGVVVGLLIGVLLSLLLPPSYRAKVVVLPLRASESEGLLSGIADQLGGLAAIAGIGAQSGDSRDEALAYLRSSALAASFIEQSQITRLLFPEKWDAADAQWNVTDPNLIPSKTDSIRVFQDDVLGISEDRRAAVVTVSMSWADPVLAANWANAFVALANEQLRSRKVAESERVLQYLNAEVAKTTVLELRAALYRLVEIELKSVALAKSREQFAFRVIDPAIAPDLDDPAKPNRPLTIALSAFGGFVIAAFAFIMGFGRRSHPSSAERR